MSDRHFSSGCNEFNAAIRALGAASEAHPFEPLVASAVLQLIAVANEQHQHLHAVLDIAQGLQTALARANARAETAELELDLLRSETNHG